MNLVHIKDSFYLKVQNYATRIRLWRIFDFQNPQTPKVVLYLSLISYPGRASTTILKYINLVVATEKTGECFICRWISTIRTSIVNERMQMFSRQGFITFDNEDFVTYQILWKRLYNRYSFLHFFDTLSSEVIPLMLICGFCCRFSASHSGW
jgi:hypothetical protein